MSPFTKKLAVSFSIGLLLAPGLYLAFRPAEKVEATGIPVVETFNIPNIIFKAVETAAYVGLKKILQLGSVELINSAFNALSSAGPGQAPLFEQRPLGQIMSEVGGAAIQGLVSGAAYEIDRQNERRAKQQQYESDLTNFDEDTQRLISIRKNAPEFQCDALTQDIADCQINSGLPVCPGIDTRKTNCANIDKEIAARPEKQANLSEQLLQYDLTKDDRDRKALAETVNQGIVSPQVSTIVNQICNPNPAAQLQILVPALSVRTTTPPLCDVQRAFTSWSQVVQNTGIGAANTDGWRVLRGLVSPEKSDLGIALRLRIGSFEQQITDQQIAQATRLVEQDNMGVKTKTGDTNTPPTVVNDILATAISGVTGVDKDFTGNFIADVVSTILSTLANNTITLITRGVAIQNGGGLYNAGSVSYKGLKAQKARTAQIVKAKFSEGGSSDVLFELQNTDCKNGGLNACTISSSFGSAISKELTVQQAVEQGLLSDNMVFGYDSNGSEPVDYANNLPYRSLVILRRYRVLPVSWELAAQYIKKHPEVCPLEGGVRVCTLGYLKRQFSVNGALSASGNPFRGMVDPNWVLKFPENKCVLSGAGSIVESIPPQPACKFDTNGDGNICCEKTCGGTNDLGSCVEQCPNPDVKVNDATRREVCVDSQSCLKTDASGKCIDFGYCLEEKSTWKFQGTQCDAQFNTCTTYTNRSNGKKVSYLANSVQAMKEATNSACTSDTLGCRELSSSRTSATQWSTLSGDQRYLTAKAVQCSADQEGCRAFSGSTTGGLRIAPDYYSCSNPEDYTKPECSKYAFSCKGFEGCEQYAPTDGSASIAGVTGTQCSASCVGLKDYDQQATQFESGSKQYFIGKAAQQCNARDVGCDQYTNLDVGSDRAGEAIAYYSQVQACEPKPTTPHVFYSWEGSDVNGYTLVTYNLAVDSNGAPKNAYASIGDCNAGIYKQQFSNPKLNGSVMCKEFFNTQGKVFYKYVNNLIYETDDCHPYRNENSATKQVINITPSLSRSCSPSANKCREYRGTEAGNKQIILSDFFAAGDSAGWLGAGVLPSNDAPAFEANSLLVSNGMTQKQVSLGTGNFTYSLLFTSNAPQGTVINAELFRGPGSSDEKLGSFQSITQRVNGWDVLPVPVTFVGNANLPTTAYLRISSSDGKKFNLGTITLTRTEGVIYAIKDSWKANTAMQQCDAAIANGGRANQLNCAAYQNRAGQVVNINGFSKSCPLAMVGCKEMTNGQNEKVSLVDDAEKSCRPAEAADCTAYGVRAGNTWTTEYYRITPAQAAGTGLSEDKKNWVCSSQAVRCSEYTIDGTGGTDTFNDPKGRVCSYKDGGWIAKKCATTSEACGADSDCTPNFRNGVNTNTCSLEVPCSDSASASGYVKACPVEQNTCRQIIDPACRAKIDGSGDASGYLTFNSNPSVSENTNNYGRGGTASSCQRDYYYLSDVGSGECPDGVNPDAGCLLFNDTSKSSVGLIGAKQLYEKYAPNTSIPLSAASKQNDADIAGNVVIKVQPDRQCKTWLACTSSMKVGDREVCFDRAPCDKGDGNNCQNIITSSNLVVGNLLAVNQTDPRIIKNLSGLSRPDFTWSDGTNTDGGHDGYFAWKQQSDPAISYTVTSDGSVNPFGRLVSNLSITTRTGEVQIVNSCRLYPQSDAPYRAEWTRLSYNSEGNVTKEGVKSSVDACYYSDQNLVTQKGVYGYCLEPYPNTAYQDDYKQTRSATATGYVNACLSWHPITYVNGQYDTLNVEQQLQAYSGPRPLYYCLQGKGGGDGWDKRPASTNALNGYIIKTRDTSIFRFKDYGNFTPEGLAALELRDTEAYVREGATTSASITNAVLNVRTTDLGSTSDASLQNALQTDTFGINSQATGMQTATIRIGGLSSDVKSILCDIDRYQDDSLRRNVETSLGITDFINPPSPGRITFFGKISGPVSNGEFSWTIQGRITDRVVQEKSLQVRLYCYVSTQDGAWRTMDANRNQLGYDGAHWSEIKNSNGTSLTWAEIRNLNMIVRTYKPSAPVVGNPVVSFDSATYQGLAPNSSTFVVNTADSNIQSASMQISGLDVSDVNTADCNIDNEATTSPFEDERLQAEEKARVFNLTFDSSQGYPGIRSQSYARIVGDPRNGVLRWAIQAKPRSISDVTKLPLPPITLYCKFTMRGGTVISYNLTFYIQAVNGSLARNPIIESVVASVKNITAKAVYNISTMANNVVTATKGLFGRERYDEIGNLIDDFRIAAVDSSKVVKPRILITDQAGRDLGTSPRIRFTADEAFNGTSKSIVVKSSASVNVNGFRWRAIVDPSKTTTQIRRSSGSYSWIALSPAEERGNNESLTISIDKASLSGLTKGIYSGTVKVFMTAPLEGIEGGITQREIVVELEVPSTFGGNLTAPKEGDVVEEDPQEDFLAMETFYPKIEFLNIDKELNSGSINESGQFTGQTPKYEPRGTIEIKFNPKNTGLCAGNERIEVRMVYRFESQTGWHADPPATMKRVNSSEPLQIDPNWKTSGCGPIDFKMPSGNGGGIEYYFQANNLSQGVKFKSQSRFIDVVNPSGAPQDDIRNANTPIDAKARDPQFGISDEPYKSVPVTPGAINFDLYTPVNEGQIGWKHFFYRSPTSTSCGDDGCCSTWNETEINRSYDIEGVSSLSSPISYCGSDYSGGACQDVPWLTDEPKTRLVEKGGSGTEGIYSTSNAMYLHGELIDPLEVKNKFRADSKPYLGQVQIHTRDEGENRSFGVGTCSFSNVTPFTRDNGTKAIQANLLVQPKITFSPSKLDFIAADAGTAKSITIASDPQEVVYHWRARLKSIEPMSRPAGGSYEWLSFTPQLGMSGTTMAVSIGKDVAEYFEPGATYKAVIEVFATSPVSGPLSKDIEVTLKAPITGSQNQVTIQTISSSTQNGKEVFSYTPEKAMGDDSAIILTAPPGPINDSGVQTSYANLFEKRLTRDQIASITYIVEHRTRDTLPGVNWKNKDVLEGMVVASPDAIQVLGPTYFALIGGPSAILGSFIGSAIAYETFQQYHYYPGLNYANFLAKLVKYPRPEIITGPDTDFIGLMKSSFASDVTEKNVWSAACSGRKDGVSNDFAAIRPVFKKDNTLEGWSWRYCDASSDIPGENHAIFVSIVIQLKDFCTDVVQVVGEDGRSAPWVERIKNLDTNGAPLLASTAMSGANFHAMVPPAGRPEQWPAPVDVVHTRTGNLASADPISSRKFSGGFCASTPTNTCTSNSQCGNNDCIITSGPICIGGTNAGAACSDEGGCGQGGMCVGTGQTGYQTIDAAKGLVQQYFARSYGYWKWNDAKRRYEASSEQKWDPSQVSGAVDPQLIKGNGQPGVDVKYTNNGTNAEVSFYSEIDPDQKPLTSIEVNWGDGLVNTIKLTSDDRPYAEKIKHLFVHKYLTDARRGTISVTITDNWGKKVTKQATLE